MRKVKTPILPIFWETIPLPIWDQCQHFAPSRRRSCWLRPELMGYAHSLCIVSWVVFIFVLVLHVFYIFLPCLVCVQSTSHTFMVSSQQEEVFRLLHLKKRPSCCEGRSCWNTTSVPCRQTGGRYTRWSFYPWRKGTWHPGTYEILEDGFNKDLQSDSILESPATSPTQDITRLLFPKPVHVVSQEQVISWFPTVLKKSASSHEISWVPDAPVEIHHTPAFWAWVDQLVRQLSFHINCFWIFTSFNNIKQHQPTSTKQCQPFSKVQVIVLAMHIANHLHRGIQLQKHGLICKDLLGLRCRFRFSVAVVSPLFLQS